MIRIGPILTDKDIDVKSVKICFISVIRVPFLGLSGVGVISAGNSLR